MLLHPNLKQVDLKVFRLKLITWCNGSANLDYLFSPETVKVLDLENMVRVI